MSLRYEILGLLSYGENTGYELTKLINSKGLFFWQAQQSQVYREIAKLEDEGLLTASGNSTPHKKLYTVTSSGLTSLTMWLNEKDTLSSAEIRNPLVMKLFFSNLADRRKTVELLEEYKAQCKSLLSDIAASRGETKALSDDQLDTIYFSLNSYYGIGFYNFSIEWADKCIGVINKLIQME